MSAASARVGRGRQPKSLCPCSATRRLNKSLQCAALARIGRQEDVAHAVKAGFGQIDTQVGLGRIAQEFVGQAGQNSGTVPGVGFAPAGAPMHHVPQDAIRIIDDLPRPDPLDVGDKADSATVVLEGRVVQPVLFRRTVPAERLRRIRVLGGLLSAQLGTLDFLTSAGGDRLQAAAEKLDELPCRIGQRSIPPVDDSQRAMPLHSLEMDGMKQARFDLAPHGGSRQERHAGPDLDGPLDVLHVIENVD